MTLTKISSPCARDATSSSTGERYWHSNPTQAKSRPRKSLFACPRRKAFAMRRLDPFRSARGERCEHDERIMPTGSVHRAGTCRRARFCETNPISLLFSVWVCRDQTGTWRQVHAVGGNDSRFFHTSTRRFWKAASSRVGGFSRGDTSAAAARRPRAVHASPRRCGADLPRARSRRMQPGSPGCRSCARC